MSIKAMKRTAYRRAFCAELSIFVSKTAPANVTDQTAGYPDVLRRKFILENEARGGPANLDSFSQLDK